MRNVQIMVEEIDVKGTVLEVKLNLYPSCGRCKSRVQEGARLCDKCNACLLTVGTARDYWAIIALWEESGEVREITAFR